MSYTEDKVFQSVQQIRTAGALETALTTVWGKWSNTTVQAVHVTLGYTNYKPFKRARMMAEATVVPADGAPAISLHLFLHVFADAESAGAEAEQGSSLSVLPCAAPPIVHVPQWHTIIWLLPNTPTLTELAWLMDPDAFCRLLLPSVAVNTDLPYYPAPKLLRYVPLKRAILTWDDPYAHSRYFVKLLNNLDASRVVRNFREINAAAARGELRFSIPQLVGDNASRHAFVMTEVQGQPFTDMMRDCHPALYDAVGRMLAQLHSCYASPEAVWIPHRELESVRRHMAGLERALPPLGAQLEDLMANLENASLALSFPDDAPIHGNLFGDQILVSPKGVGMVDWDTLSLGDPLYDIGRLLAHLVYLAGREVLDPQAVSACADVLLAAYEEESHQPVDRRRLAWHVATQLLLRGKISSLRQLPEGWQAHLDFVIAEAAYVFNGKSCYLSLPTLSDLALEV